MQKIFIVFIEMVLVLSIACAIGTAYNAYAVKPTNELKGLNWDLKVFRPAKAPKPKADITKLTPSEEAKKAASDADATISTDGAEQIENPKVEEAPKHGMQAMSVEEAQDYYDLGKPITVFVDARSQDHYDDLRIKDAIHIYLPQVNDMSEEVRASLNEADFIVVYCNGGDCEDSITLAENLVNDQSIPYEKVWVFEGGIKEWKEHKLPMEGVEADAEK